MSLPEVAYMTPRAHHQSFHHQGSLPHLHLHQHHSGAHRQAESAHQLMQDVGHSSMMMPQGLVHSQHHNQFGSPHLSMGYTSHRIAKRPRPEDDTGAEEGDERARGLNLHMPLLDTDVQGGDDEGNSPLLLSARNDAHRFSQHSHSTYQSPTIPQQQSQQSSAQTQHHHHRLPTQVHLQRGQSGGMSSPEMSSSVPSVVGQPGMPEPAPEPRAPKLKFTASEDALLVDLKENRNLTWKQIADFFPGRTSGTLQVRYCTKLKAKTTVWTDESVVRLRNAMQEYENDRWRLVAAKVGSGFSPTACREKAAEL